LRYSSRDQCRTCGNGNLIRGPPESNAFAGNQRSETPVKWQR
jgi:hypothetical protein